MNFKKKDILKGHKFHKECFEEWLKRGTGDLKDEDNLYHKCPLCRTDIFSSYALKTKIHFARSYGGSVTGAQSQTPSIVTNANTLVNHQFRVRPSMMRSQSNLNKVHGRDSQSLFDGQNQRLRGSSNSIIGTLEALGINPTISILKSPANNVSDPCGPTSPERSSIRYGLRNDLRLRGDSKLKIVRQNRSV